MAQFYVEIRRKATRTKNKDGSGRWAPPGLKIAHNEHSDRASLVILSGDHVGGYSYRREEGIGIFTHGWSDQTGKQFNIESAAGNFNRLEIDFNNATVRLTKDRAGALDTFLYRDTDRIIITNNPLLIRRDNLEMTTHLFLNTSAIPTDYSHANISIKESNVLRPVRAWKWQPILECSLKCPTLLLGRKQTKSVWERTSTMFS